MKAGGKSLVMMIIITVSLLMIAVSAAASQTPHRDTRVQALASLNTLVNAPESPISPGTTVRAFSLSNGFATVDFSREFKSNFPGGDSREIDMINGVLASLGKTSAISRVQILIDGKKVESIGGVLIISEPLDVIRPNRFLNH